MSYPLAPYPSPEDRDAALRTLAARAHGEVLELGRSVEGRPILAARVPQAEREGTPACRVLVTGNIHGLEFVSGACALAVLERLGDVPGLRRLHGRAELWVAPCLNPDGYARTWAQEGQGTVKELRTNAHGVDLNRNFPLPQGHVRRRLPGAGSRNPAAATFTGEHPLSEPESTAVATLLAQHRFDAAINGHSFFGAVIPARTLTRAEHTTYAALHRALRAAQTQAPYVKLSTRWFDTFTGELEDFQHHVHGLWAVCLETFAWKASFKQHLPGFAPSVFWRFNPRHPAPWLDNDVPAVAAFLNAAIDVGRRKGNGPPP